MRTIGFENIHIHGQVVEQNERYSFYQLEEIKNRYDSNFMKLREMPTTDEFKKIVEELRSLAIGYGNEHGKIVFPEGEKPSKELIATAEELGFEWSFLELYEIQPQAFVGECNQERPELQIGWISPELMDEYGQMHFEETIQSGGEAYATAIRKYKKTLIERGDIRIVVALLNGKLVGSTDLILGEQFIEIDDFFVKSDYQKQGIGTAIQLFVMKEACERTVILVADGEDTPREMYFRQGYQYVTFQYAALCQEFVKY